MPRRRASCAVPFLSRAASSFGAPRRRASGATVLSRAASGARGRCPDSLVQACRAGRRAGGRAGFVLSARRRRYARCRARRLKCRAAVRAGHGPFQDPRLSEGTISIKSRSPQWSYSVTVHRNDSLCGQCFRGKRRSKCATLFFISLARMSADGYASSDAVAGCFFLNETDALQAGPLAVVIVPAPESQQRFARAK